MNRERERESTLLTTTENCRFIIALERTLNEVEKKMRNKELNQRQGHLEYLYKVSMMYIVLFCISEYRV